MKRVHVWLKGLFYLGLLPWLMIRLSQRWDPMLPQLPNWLTIAPGVLIAILGAYVALRGYLVLAALGKEWPFGPTLYLIDKYIYRFVRHPIYWGYVVFWLGVGLCRNSMALVLEALALGLIFLVWILLVEDPSLKRRFGTRFLEFRRNSPLILPYWKELYYDVVDYNWILLLTATLARKLFPFLWKVKAEGLEHVPQEGGFILVSNHVNYVDGHLMGMFLNRPIRYMATDELFRKPISRILFTMWGAFPKRRWSRDISALRKLRKWVSEGQPVCIFPEGQRNWDGGPVAVGDEVYRFLYSCQAPIMCVSLLGAHEAFPRWAKLPSFTQLTVKFFPMIQPGEYNNAASLRKAIEARIFDFVNQPPSERRILNSHSGITVVTWGCLKCGGVRTMEETETGVKCKKCGASWRVNSKLELIDDQNGRVLLEREYHSLLKKRLAAGTLQGGYATSASAFAYRIESTDNLIKLSQGTLTIDENVIAFSGGEIEISMRVKDIKFAYLNLANHLVVNDGNGAYQFALTDDSPVRWEDYVTAIRGLGRQTNEDDQDADHIADHTAPANLDVVGGNHAVGSEAAATYDHMD